MAWGGLEANVKKDVKTAGLGRQTNWYGKARGWQRRRDPDERPGRCLGPEQPLWEGGQHAEARFESLQSQLWGCLCKLQ